VFKCQLLNAKALRTAKKRKELQLQEYILLALVALDGSSAFLCVALLPLRSLR
jgi:hypothetical protein